MARRGAPAILRAPNPPRPCMDPHVVRTTRPLRRRLAIALLIAAGQAGAAGDPAPIDWPARTLADVAAIDEWVRGAYPGMVDPDNPGFAPRWTQAAEAARSRATQVADAGGWRATVFALAHAARDAHVALAETAPPPTRRWAGIALERRGDAYVARRPAEGTPGVDARVDDGAVLVSCDGEPADAALRRRVHGWISDWEIPAFRSMYASSVFVDRGNPFAPTPIRCVFDHQGERREIELQWTEVDAKALSAALAPFRRVRRQVDRVELAFADDGAAWVVLGNLWDHAANTALTATLGERREDVLAAPYLVFDLRGNGGGDSSLADAHARALWGRFSLVPGREPAGPKRWRASPLVIETLQQMRDAVAASDNPNPNLVAAADRLLPLLRDAVAEGEPLPRQSWWEGRLPRWFERDPPAHARPVYVLTDGGCFSSCILASYMLQRMGAVQVGDPTGVHTMYGEAWFQRPLPSGLATLTLPVSINAYPAGELGGEAPDLPWTGAADDEAGLRAMIAADARGRRVAGT